MISRADIRAARAPLASFVVVGIAWGGFAAQVPVIKARAGAGDAEFGMALLVAALGAIAAMWLAPRIDHAFQRRALVVMSAGLAIAYLGPGLVSSVVMLALAMLVVTTFSGSLDVIMNARLAGVEAAQGRSLMNFGHATFSFAYAGAAILAGLLRDIGWPPVMIFAALGAISLGLCFIAAQDQAEAIAEENDTTAPLAPRLIWLGGGVILIGFMAEQASEGWSALHLERSLGADAVGGAFGPAILGLTMGMGRLAGQGLAQIYAPLRVIAVAASVAAVGAGLASASQTLWVAYLGFGLLGLGISVIAPMAYAHVAARVSPRLRTLAIARISVIGYTGFFIGPPLMGFLAEGFGLGVSFGVIGAALVIITLALVPALTQVDRKAAHAD